MTVEVNRESLQAAADQVINLILAKNADYGDAWQKHSAVGIFVRLSDKGLRIEHLTNGNQALVLSEGWKDTLLDIAGYALLGLLLVD